MKKFVYTAKDKTGRTIKGDAEASSKEQALETLRSKEFLVLKLEEIKKKNSFFSLSFSKRSSKITTEDLVIFTRQMATMSGAGITILNALETLATQMENPDFKAVLFDVRDLVNTGASLSEAMYKHKKVFSVIFYKYGKSWGNRGYA